MNKSHPGRTGFEGIKGTWREAEAWHSKRPREDGKGTASVKVEGPGLKNHVQKMRPGTIKMAYEKLFLKVKLKLFVWSTHYEPFVKHVCRLCAQMS